jgi:pimeloyl-ACP methyl ester carboxylesterase
MAPMQVVSRIDVGEVQLQCTLWNNEKGSKLVVLLHGFPECAATWGGVAQKLADAGYRVVAPDMRGYGGSDRPKDVDDYGVEHLTADVTGLVRALGAERAHVVGHDWGAVVAWWTAMLHPESVEKLAILNGPHPVGYERALRSWDQLHRALYVFFFQLPFLPELVVSARDFAVVRRLFAGDGVPAQEVIPCVDALRPDGAVSAALSYYRARFREGITGAGPKPRKVDAPTLVVWGEKDHYLVPALAVPPADWVANARVVRLPDVTHWSQIEAAADVVRELRKHFAS